MSDAETIAGVVEQLEDIHADTEDDERAGVLLAAMSLLRRCARDDKGRGPEYRRGSADGAMVPTAVAQRAARALRSLLNEFQAASRSTTAAVLSPAEFAGHMTELASIERELS